MASLNRRVDVSSEEEMSSRDQRLRSAQLDEDPLASSTTKLHEEERRRKRPAADGAAAVGGAAEARQEGGAGESTQRKRHRRTDGKARALASEAQAQPDSSDGRAATRPPRDDAQSDPSATGQGAGTGAASVAGTNDASSEGRDGGLGGEAEDCAPLPRNAVVDGDEDDELEDQCNVETIEILLAAYAQEAAAELLTSPPGKSEERGDEAPFVTECLDDLFIRNQYQREAVNRLVDVAATSQEDDVAEYLGQKLTSYLQLYLKVKANPGGYDPANLSDAFNRDRLETGERIERAERKGQSEHLSSEINQGNPTSPSTLVLGLLHFGPTGSKSNGRYDCNAHDQCCIKAIRQSLNRCTFHACFGERTEETFEEEMPTVDLLPINADKGSQDELDAQVEACASRLGLASKYEVYAINLLNYIGHAIVHLAQHQSALTVVVASSVTSERWFSEVGRGKYLLGILKSPGANVVFTLHPQAWLMGVNQSLRRYPEDIRRGINSVMKFVLGKLIRQKLLDPEAKETFDNYVCDVMGSFGRKGKWIESDIQFGLLNALAKVAANHNLLEMSGEALADALTSERLIQALGEDTVALFLAQIDLHRPPTFMKLLRKFRAPHETITLASQMFNGELKSAELVDAVARIAQMGEKPPSVVMQNVLKRVHSSLKRSKSSFDGDDQDAIDRVGSNPSISMNELLPLIEHRLERRAREAAETEERRAMKAEERRAMKAEAAEIIAVPTQISHIVVPPVVTVGDRKVGANYAMNNDAATGVFPKEEDVLFGRGGWTNHHPGNHRLRKIVNRYRAVYHHARKNDKPKVSKLIVGALRSANPPSRFLRMNDDTALWEDVGDKRAAEKVSQTLREKEKGAMDKAPTEGVDAPMAEAPGAEKEAVWAPFPQGVIQLGWASWASHRTIWSTLIPTKNTAQLGYYARGFARKYPEEKKRLVAAHEAQKESAVQDEQRQRAPRNWRCDICKEVVFDTFEKAVAHEAECTGPSTEAPVDTALDETTGEPILWP